ncbi:hypothetical protein Tco_0265313 [Tanacetum coccineum]
MNEDYYDQNSCYDPNSFGFDQYQPPQFPVNYPPQETNKEILQDVCTFLRKFSRIPFGVTQKDILIAWESFGEIKDALMDKQYRQEDIQELMSKLLEDV